MVGRRARTAAVVVAAMVAALAPGGPARAANAVPVVTDDVVTAYVGGDDLWFQPLANDTDDADDLAICSTTSSKNVRVATDDGDGFEEGQNWLGVTVPTDHVGTYAFRYGACDYSYIVSGKVTVKVVQPDAPTITKDDDQVGRVTVSNPDDAWLGFFWISPNDKDGETVGIREIGPHESSTFNTGLSSFDWGAGIEGEQGYEFADASFTGLYDWTTGTDAPWEPGSLQSGRISAFAARHAVHHRTTVTARSAGSSAGRSAGRSTATSMAPTPVDPTTVAPPVVHNETTTWWAGSHDIVPVLANDRDPARAPLRLCRLGSPDATTDSYGSASPSQNSLQIYTSQAKTATLRFPYYACNASRLSRGVLTIHLRTARVVQARQVKGHTNEIRFTNPNPVPVTMSMYIAGPGHAPVRVLAHRSVTVSLAKSAVEVIWVTSIGKHHGFAGEGDIAIRH